MLLRDVILQTILLFECSVAVWALLFLVPFVYDSRPL